MLLLHVTILVGILNLAKVKIFMGILDFGTYMACLWESPILVSHKHAICVPKSRILMSTFKYVQKYCYFSMASLVEILNLGKGKIFMRILDFGTYMACLWESPILVSHKHAICAYQNLEFSWARPDMYKHNVTFARVFSWGFWILRMWTFSREFWILVHIWRAYENPLFWCLISTPYVFQNLEFSWARSNMYKNNVTFAWLFSWGFWIWGKGKFWWVFWIFLHIWRAYENPLFWCLISTPYMY